MKQILAFLLTLTLLAGLCACAAQNRPDPDPADEQETADAAETGLPAETDPPADAADRTPDIVFTTTDLSDETWTEACFAGHKLTLINLWAYWCGPCMSELPDLQKLAEDYSDRGLQLLLICDPAEAEQDAAALESLGVTIPCLLYTDAFDDALATGYYPTTVFLDEDGRLLDSAYVGSRSYDQWAAIIEEYLK